MPIILEHVTYDYQAPVSGKKKKGLFRKGKNNQEGAAQAGPSETAALKDVSLTIGEGEFLGVIGHTGSGKSTMMQLIDGLLIPTSGRVLVDGLDTSDKKLRKAAREPVGLVFQYPEYQLFEETVAKDIAFGPKNLGLSEQEIADRVRESMYFVGLDPDVFSEKSPFELSGGEKRRTALAGMIAMRPKYLVLDEPMAGLDPMGRQSILDMLLALRKKTGCTVIMVSHSMDDMVRFADRVLVMAHGELVRIGTADEVFSDGAYLESLRLNVPQAARLATLLRENGVPVPQGAVRSEEVTEYLLSRYAERKEAAE